MNSRAEYNAYAADTLTGELLRAWNALDWESPQRSYEIAERAGVERQPPAETPLRNAVLALIEHGFPVVEGGGYFKTTSATRVRDYQASLRARIAGTQRRITMLDSILLRRTPGVATPLVQTEMF